MQAAASPRLLPQFLISKKMKRLLPVAEPVRVEDMIIEKLISV
jgi:hypothetical protein